jgi:hypothetical protein
LEHLEVSVSLLEAENCLMLVEFLQVLAKAQISQVVLSQLSPAMEELILVEPSAFAAQMVAPMEFRGIYLSQAVIRLRGIAGLLLCELAQRRWGSEDA